jgi:uncharacterized RDD family membrane protein YckC
MNELKTFRSCHQILGVLRDATPDEVAQAYLRAALPVHPIKPQADEALQRQARARFREVTDAWAVMADAATSQRAGLDADARALALCEETLAWRALSLACGRLDEHAVARALVEDGCPQELAWPAAEAAVKLSRLGAKPRALMREKRKVDQADRRDEEAKAADTMPDLDALLIQRFAATVADLGLLALVCIGPSVGLGMALGWSWMAIERLALGVLLLGSLVFYIGAEERLGATPGKRLVGLRVVKVRRGAAIDRQTAWLRHGLRLLSYCLGGIGLVTVFFTERRQALHDLLTDTRVRYDGTGRPELVPVLCWAPAAVVAIGLVLKYAS